MRGILTNSRILWALVFVQVLIWVGFVSIMYAYDFVLIDEMWKPDEIRNYIAGFSPEQKRAHIWTTATLDVLYPLTYGSFFVGMALRFYGPAGKLLSMPGVLVIPVDLTEGVIQVMALSGRDEVIVHKAWVTPWKLGLFGAATLITLVAIAIALWRKFGPTSGG